MSITSYSTLRSAVDSYLVYSDVDSMFDTFLQLAEARMNREVRVREMESVETRTALVSAGPMTKTETMTGPTKTTTSPLVEASGVAAVAVGANSIQLYSAVADLPSVGDVVTLNGLVDYPNFPGTVPTNSLNGTPFPVTLSAPNTGIFRIDISPLQAAGPPFTQAWKATNGTFTTNSAGTTTTSTTTTVGTTMEGGFLLNTSFLEMISVTELGQGSLQYVTPRMIREALALSPAQGQPSLYSVMNETVYLHPQTDSTRSYTIDYYRKIDPLTSINSANVILDMAPDLYLYGVLSEAQPYLGDADRSAEYNALFQRSINAINNQDTRSRQRPGARIMTRVTRDGAFRIA